MVKDRLAKLARLHTTLSLEKGGGVRFSYPLISPNLTPITHLFLTYTLFFQIWALKFNPFSSNSYLISTLIILNIHVLPKIGNSGERFNTGMDHVKI